MARKQAAASLVLGPFLGMNEKRDLDAGLGFSRTTTPRVILNADAFDGRLLARKNIKKVISMSLPTSLWAPARGRYALCYAGTELSKIVKAGDGAADVSLLASFPDALEGEPLSFEEFGGLVYFSNRWLRGSFDPETETVGSWGLQLPEVPVLVATSAGGLVPGVYQVALVPESGGLLGGNSQIVSIELPEGGGIEVYGDPAAEVFSTEANGEVFYRIGKTSRIVGVPTVEPLTSLWSGPPPNFSLICAAHGRMWGALDEYVYFSSPFRPDLFRSGFYGGEGDRFRFPGPVTMVARSAGGMFVSDSSGVFFLGGTDPSASPPLRRVCDAPALSGSLAYVSGTSVGFETTGEVPVWLGVDDFYAGAPDGQAVPLLKGRVIVKTDPAARACVTAFTQSGWKRFLITYTQSQTSAGMGDDAICIVTRSGEVIND